MNVGNLQQFSSLIFRYLFSYSLQSLTTIVFSFAFPKWLILVLLYCSF